MGVQQKITHPGGIEPPTSRLTVWRSKIQLSYRCNEVWGNVVKIYIIYICDFFFVHGFLIFFLTFFF